VLGESIFCDSFVQKHSELLTTKQPTILFFYTSVVIQMRHTVGYSGRQVDTTHIVRPGLFLRKYCRQQYHSVNHSSTFASAGMNICLWRASKSFVFYFRKCHEHEASTVAREDRVVILLL
jgi:hypothetical protein